MQLKKRQVAASLAMATCTLLGSAQGPSLAAEERKWSFDTALHHYDEGDRVTDTSASFLTRRIFGKERLLSLQLTIDTLTGASASGAAPAGGPQTFTTPSGMSSYSIGAGQTPLDPTFLDTRIAFNGSWSHLAGRRGRLTYGLSLSGEYDYFHTGINARYSRDFNERNTTFNIGVALGRDSLDPEGGVPTPLSSMLPVGDLSNRLADESKSVTDLVVGFNQVLGRNTIGQVNYSFSRSSGYLTDPYKILSVVDPMTGDPVAGPGALNLFLFESRPDSRTKHSLFARLKHSLGRDIIDASYRYMTDDWGIDSHTLDFHYRWRLGRWSLTPHLRYYTQTRADFYQRVLFDGAPVPPHASADYRLGDLDGTTVGLRLGRTVREAHEWSLRVEYYSQSGTSPPGSSVGSLAAFDLFPGVDALIVQLGYRF